MNDQYKFFPASFKKKRIAKKTYVKQRKGKLQKFLIYFTIFYMYHLLKLSLAGKILFLF